MEHKYIVRVWSTNTSHKYGAQIHRTSMEHKDRVSMEHKDRVSMEHKDRVSMEHKYIE